MGRETARWRTDFALARWRLVKAQRFSGASVAFRLHGGAVEVFVLGEDGSLSHANGEACVAMRDDNGAMKVEMEDCRVGGEMGGSGSVFELTPSGQLRAPKAGSYCVSASGSLVESDLAAAADVRASSGAGAREAVDGDDGSYWASAGDAAKIAPIDFELTFGAPARLATVEIAWEFPAKVRFCERAGACC